MSEDKIYTVDFTTHEIESLKECLAHLNKHFSDCGNTGNALDQPVFRAGCELQYKLAKVTNPDIDISVDDFLALGR